MKNNKIFKYIIMFIISVAAVFTLAACSGNEFNGAGAGTISIILDKEYDGVQVGCPEGEITQNGKEYTIKVKSRKQTDVIVSCEGYYTQAVTVLTKDFVGGVAQKSVSLEKRYNILTLSVSGVSDINEVKVTADDGVIKEQNVNGKKIEVVFNDFDAQKDGAALNVACDGYFTNNFEVNATDFTDYAATFRINLISTSSTDAAVTFINDLDGEYGFDIYPAVSTLGTKSVARVSLRTSSTQILDTGMNYYIEADGNRYGEVYFTPIKIKGLTSPYVTLRASTIKGIQYLQSSSDYTRYTIGIPFEMREANTSLYRENGAAVNFDTYNGYINERMTVGEKIRVVSYIDRYQDRKLISCYETEFTGGNFSLEAGRIEENIKVKIRFVDKDGKPQALSSVPFDVKLFNGWAVNDGEGGLTGWLLKNSSETYIDIDDPEFGVAQKENDAIVIDVKKFSELTLKGGENAGEKYISMYAFYKTDSENQETGNFGFFDILGGSNYDIKLPYELKFKIKLYKYNAEDPEARDYVNDLHMSADEGMRFEYNALFGCYTCETSMSSVFDINLRSDNKSYSGLRFLAAEELYEKDGEYCVMEVPVYETKDIHISASGDLPSEKGEGYANFEGGGSCNVYIQGDSQSGQWFLSNANETLIGKKFTLTIRLDYSTRYTAAGTLTKEFFDNGYIPLTFTRVQENNI